MANESKWAHVWLEIPNHDGAVAGARHDLLEVGVEASREHAVLVSLEGSLEGWVRERTSLPLDSSLTFDSLFGAIRGWFLFH